MMSFSASNPLAATQICVDDLVRQRTAATQLPMRTRRRSKAPLAGAEQSPFKGRGMDFSEVRAYQPGDDIRNMDWRVTARTGQAHTKLYAEERERPVIFVLDLRSHMQFGTQVCFKSVAAARACALLAWQAKSHGDRVGGLVFNEHAHIEHRPTAGTRGVVGLFHSMLKIQKSQAAQRDDAPWLSVIQRLRRVARPGSMIVIASDFLGLDERSGQMLGQLGQHCELVNLFVYDRLESNPPANHVFPVSDGRNFSWLDTNSRNCQALTHWFEERENGLKLIARRYGLHHLALATDDPLAQRLREGLIQLR